MQGIINTSCVLAGDTGSRAKKLIPALHRVNDMQSTFDVAGAQGRDPLCTVAKVPATISIGPPFRKVDICIGSPSMPDACKSEGPF